MPFRPDQIDSVADLLTSRKIIVSAIGELNRDNIRNALEFFGRQFLFTDVYLCVRKRAQLSGMITVLLI